MLVGYIRLSLQEPTPERQLEALRQAGCEKVIIDERNGARCEQPGFDKACALMQPGDTLVVWRLDRLGCSFKQVVEHVEALQRRQLGLRSLHEEIDTTGPDGPAQLRVFAALVACEHNLWSERTLTGLGIARARRRLGGRKPKMTPDMIQQAAQLIKNPDISVQQICQQLAISRATLYRYVSPTGEVRQE
jgi:DNA invertase Pin-like site-specific DNA recombinase